MDLIPRNKFYFDDVFDDFMGRAGVMNCDIYEKDNKYHVEVDIPGFNKEDIKLNYNKGYLTIKASKSEKHDEKDGKKYLRRERSYATYERTFYLDDINDNEIDASYKDGTLYIVAPKKEENQNKKSITIK